MEEVLKGKENGDAPSGSGRVEGAFDVDSASKMGEVGSMGGFPTVTVRFREGEFEDRVECVDLKLVIVFSCTGRTEKDLVRDGDGRGNRFTAEKRSTVRQTG